MNVNDMLKMIDDKVKKDNDAKLAEERRTREEYERLLREIRALKPRIDDLIRVANFAKYNGIDFDKRGYGGRDSYDVGVFYTNGWSHMVGFVHGEPICRLGIDAGGACGSIDFRTDGTHVYGLDERTNAVTKPKIDHMRKFLANFNSFENEFYKYIEIMCK